MSFGPGTRVGAYQILSHLGAGGMGIVYRASDTRLGREVAMKTLPSHLASDPERVARFEREAQVLAALNHPHIAAIYGLEVGDGTPFLVLELVHGETLDRRIAKGRLPVHDALQIARQIADALEAAHETGIVHRDLKPSNIAITDDGRVKVLDFGLAKLVPLPAAKQSAAAPASLSPTVTSPALATGAGVLMGTAAYMSPEQARGREADTRSDVWAFGCVLYEMLTGRRAFGGQETTEVLARVLEREPDFDALPPDTPDAIRRLLRRCLTKHGQGRLAAIGDARLDIDDAIAGRGSAQGTSVGSRSRYLPLVIGAACAASAAVAAAAVWSLGPTAPQPRPMRFVVAPPANAPLFSESTGTAVAVSRDGRQIVYAAIGDGILQLYLREVDQIASYPIPGTEGARQPFFSPDGTQVGFWATATGEIKRVPVSGGPVTTVVKAPGGNMYGASWGSDGRIVFASGPLYSVPAAGGLPEQLTTPAVVDGEVDHRWPEVLPDGRGVLFTRWGGAADRARIAVRSLDSGEEHVAIEDAHFARYAAPGHVVFAQKGSLAAAPFDLTGLRVSGERLPIQESVRTNGTGASDFSLTGDGTLVFVPGTARPERGLVWVDREGNPTPLPTAGDDYWFPRLSPDGRRLAVGIGSDIWAIELATLARTRVTFGTTSNFFPFTWWKERIAFSRIESKVGLDVYTAEASGGGQPELLVPGEYRQWATSASSDGGVLAIYQQHPRTLRDILIATADGTRTDFKVTPFQERAGRFSPDGRWLAYVSNESGRDEVYVEPFPARSGTRLTISVNGGTEPAWSPDGREIFYRDSDRMMTVPVDAGTTFTTGRPQLLFSAAFERDRGSGSANPNYDVGRDGRFIMILAPTTSMNIVVALDWLEGMARAQTSNRR